MYYHYLLKRSNLIKEEKKVVTLYGSEESADFRSLKIKNGAEIRIDDSKIEREKGLTFSAREYMGSHKS